MSSGLLAEALHREGRVITATAENSEQLIEAAESGLFQVAVVGIEFQGAAPQTLRLLHRVRKINLDLALVVLLNAFEGDLVVKLFQAGAQGAFLRSDSMSNLCKCIQCVHRGEIWASSSAINILVDALSQRVVPSPRIQAGSTLSRREEEVALLVAEGLSNRQISERLQLSEHTIKNYLFRMFEKLGVATRVELALYSLEQRASRPLPPPS